MHIHTYMYLYMYLYTLIYTFTSSYIRAFTNTHVFIRYDVMCIHHYQSGFITCVPFTKTLPDRTRSKACVLVASPNLDNSLYKGTWVAFDAIPEMCLLA